VLAAIRRALSCLLPLVATTVLAGCGGDEVASHPAPPASTVESDAGLEAVEIARGLDRPVYVTAAPSEPDRLYVVEPGDLLGKLLRLDVDERTRTGAWPRTVFAIPGASRSTGRRAISGSPT
jgi:hypothetical protein